MITKLNDYPDFKIVLQSTQYAPITKFWRGVDKNNVLWRSYDGIHWEPTLDDKTPIKDLDMWFQLMTVNLKWKVLKKD